MKLFAQHGFQQGEKISQGLERGILDGVIYSPRDIALEKLQDSLHGMADEHPDCVRLFDPQYYAVFLNGTDGARLGYLAENGNYGDYFRQRRRPELERERLIGEDLRAALRFQADLPVTAVIAPNIVIPNSLDSSEAVIAKNFIRSTAEQWEKAKGKKEKRLVYATLAIGRNALGDPQALQEFLHEITLLDNAPQGFYVLIAARNAEARSDIYNADVIAAWMFINHTLTLNGFEVVNGYSDVLTPFLCAAGGVAGALGWWSNLRSFSLDRFAPPTSGGRLPTQRYLSRALLNRILHFELDQLREIEPRVLNDLDTDDLYEKGQEPVRNTEVLQSWEAVKALNGSLVTNDQGTSLKRCKEAINEAIEIYEGLPVRLDQKSNSEHLEPLRIGLNLFSDLAEIDRTE